MATGKFVSYLRVSTDKQGRSGLGLDAQRKAVTDYLNGGTWELLAEFEEVESGTRKDRPKLAEAIEFCRATGATLLVAKIDRLARDASFLLSLKDAGIEFVAADMPDANRVTVGIMALMAEQEREAISARTKAALAAAKERGQQLGAFRDGEFVGRKGTAADAENARNARTAKLEQAYKDKVVLLKRIDPNNSLSLRKIAAQLTEMQVPTVSGKGSWTAASVKRLKGHL